MPVEPTRTPVRVAVIGGDRVGRLHFDAWARMPDVKLVGVCETDPAAAKSVSVEFSDRSGPLPVFADPVAMIEAAEPDIVDIAMPAEQHLALIRQIAPSRADIICEQPFCGDAAGAEDALEIAETFGCRIAVQTSVRFQPWYTVARRFLEDGALGEAYQAVFRFRPGDGRGPRAYLDRHPHFQKSKHFLVRETAANWIDIFSMLMGDITGVYAQLRRINPIIAGADAGFILFEFASGSRGLFDANRLSDHGAVNCRLTMGEMLIEGSTGSLRLDGAGRLWQRGFGDIEEREHRFPWRNHLFGGDCVYLCSRHILDAWLAGEEPENSAARHLHVQQIADLVIESARRGAFLPAKT